jgi:RNA polymerase sigma-70 factor (ECF subfamily)
VFQLRAAPTKVSDHHDLALLDSIAQGDRRAFEELYLLHHRRLARFLMRLAPRYEFAEEVINDTFWIVWQKAREFRGASKVSTWITGIAYRRALKSMRTARAQGATEEFDHNRNDQALGEPDRSTELQDWIAGGLRQLPDEQRMALELAYFLGHSCEEIAAIMDCPVTTVKARMFHAREKLRQCLPQLGGDEHIGRGNWQ